MVDPVIIPFFSNSAKRSPIDTVDNLVSAAISTKLVRALTKSAFRIFASISSICVVMRGVSSYEL
jgi:hypothetical protein